MKKLQPAEIYFHKEHGTAGTRQSRVPAAPCFLLKWMKKGFGAMLTDLSGRGGKYNGGVKKRRFMDDGG